MSQNSISNFEEEDIYFSQPDYIWDDNDDIISSTTVVVDYDSFVEIEGEFFDALQVAIVQCA